MRKLLEGQSAIVTGASSGIGQAIAISLAKAGADVCVNYSRDKKGAEDTCSAISEFGVKSIAVQADVSDESAVIAMFKATKDAFSAVDILISNAGMQKDAPLDQMSLDDWNRVISVNLTGQFLCMREAVKEFKKQGIRQGISKAAGKIVSISSVHEVIPWAGHVNYAASKGGVMLLMKSVAQEVAPLGIRVNSVCPGAIRTPINRAAWETPDALNSLLTLIPYKRIGEPEDIGSVVSWMVSDEADYITGASLFVDGGMLLYPGFEDNG